MATKRKIDTYVDALFQVLPASSYEEIRLGMQRELGVRLTVYDVNNTLSHLRRNVAEYGFAVPYVRRGAGGEDDGGRYFAVLAEKDGTFTVDPQHRKFFNDGSLSTVLDIGTLASNFTMMLDVFMQYERSKGRRDYLEDMRETLSFIAKRASRVAKVIKAEQKVAA